jgi:predicted  nucleic acid-binding Zn-ribbon protein
MLDSLKIILEIQELDVKMIRLIRLKHQRQKELSQIEKLTTELRYQMEEKEREILQMTHEINLLEDKIQELKAKIKRLENQQASVKKMDEFNALTQEMNHIGREKTSIEQTISHLVDKRLQEEEVLEKIKQSLATSETSGVELRNEILANIAEINREGTDLKAQRDTLVKIADSHILSIYERLLKNKKDRVVVPIENRTCSGCHISLTAQHENVVRKGENLVFCEHCSRIHYWQDLETIEDASSSQRRRRRRTAAAS